MQLTGLIPRYLLALTLTVCVYGIYGKFVAPLLEGQPVIGRTAATLPIEYRPAEDIKKELAGLFPADGWEWEPCTILETRQAKILFHDHTVLDDGSIELKPLSMVLTPASRIVDGKPVRPRPIVLRAPEGARLKFERGLSAGGDLGELQHGQLAGEVQLFRPPTTPDSDDALTMITENVQISPERIFTLYDCQFQFGQSRGRGKHLTVDLAGPDEAAETGSGSAFSDVQQIRLARVYELYLHRDRAGPAAATGMDLPLPSGLPVDTRRSFLISSEGPMVFDFQSRTAQFDDQVFVRSADDAQDRLNCHRLTVFFETRDDPAPPRKNGEDEFRVRRLLAEGQDGLPATIVSTTRQARIAADTIDYELDAGRVTLTGNGQTVSLARPGQLIQARRIQYSFTEDGRLGNAVMAGPGTIRQAARHEGDRELVCQWQDQLTLQDDRDTPGKKVMSLDGARIIMTDTTVTANQLHLWVWEVPERTADGKQRWRFEPAKMLAVGQVHIEAEKLSGDCREAAAFWPAPNAAGVQIYRAAPRRFVMTRRPPRQEPGRSGATRSAVPVSQNHTGQLSWQSIPPRRALAWQAAGTASASAPAANGTSPERVVPASFQAAANLSEANLSEKRFTRFVGEQVQLQMHGGEDPGVVDEMTVDGDVVVRQQQPAPDGVMQTRLEIRGQKLRVVSQADQRYRLFVAGGDGQRAVVAANELVLEGMAIHLDQSANRLWIDGPGTMDLDAPVQPAPDGNGAASFQAVSNADPQGLISSGVTHVQWQGGMVFDGQKLYFETAVRSHSRQTAETDASVTTTTTRSAALSIALTQRIDFGRKEALQPDSGIKATKLVMVGWMESGDVAFPDTWTPASDRRVRVSTTKRDASGQVVSGHEVFAPRATFDVESGRTYCKGPGTVIARQLAKPESANPTATTRGVPAALTSTGRRNGPIDFIKVDFDSRFEGHLENRELQFQGNVHTFYTDVSRWDTTPDESLIHRPGSRGVVMDCDHLVLAQWTPQAAEPTIELIASGDARIKGGQFDATAERISYYQMTGQIVMEAPTRSSAELWFTRPGQTNRGHLVAKTITYNLLTGESEVQEMEQMDYFRQGPDERKK